MNGGQVSIEGAPEIQRVDTVEPMKLLAPLDGPGAHIPQPAAGVGHGLGLEHAGLGLGQSRRANRCSVISVTMTNRAVTPTPSSMGQSEIHRGIGNPSARTTSACRCLMDSPDRARLVAAPTSSCRSPANKSESSRPNTSLAPRPNMRSATWPQVVTRTCRSHVKTASSEVSITGLKQRGAWESPCTPMADGVRADLKIAGHRFVARRRTFTSNSEGPFHHRRPDKRGRIPRTTKRQRQATRRSGRTCRPTSSHSSPRRRSDARGVRRCDGR